MDRWNPHQFRQSSSGVDNEVLERAIVIGNRIVKLNRDVQPIFTLKHLATVSGVDYGFLRQAVARRTDGYTVFRVRKRPTKPPQRYRIICVPTPSLMAVQRWITRNILRYASPHDASVAFSVGNTLLDAVRPHCASKWLVKIDIRNFFESISEASVYRVFRSLGFEPLVSFELARLCTRVTTGPMHQSGRWRVGRRKLPVAIPAYEHEFQGHLAQGAPTSPMLANLTCRELDESLTEIASRFSVNYTRYADDITFSSCDSAFGRIKANQLIVQVFDEFRRLGFQPNKAKTVITPPGGRKVVLGLLVEEKEPRLSREFKLRMRQHLYYMLSHDVGVVRHSDARGFTSVIGLRNHIRGLLTFAAQIEPEYAARESRKFSKIAWPI